MGISPEVADEVLVKCARHCCICHRFRPLHLHIHHIDELSAGGGHEPDDLIAVCVMCHSDVHVQTTLTRRFSARELRLHRDAVCELVRDGKLPNGDSGTCWSFEGTMVHISGGLTHDPLLDAARPARQPDSGRLALGSETSSFAVTHYTGGGTFDACETWPLDQIFGCVAPLMFDEAAEVDLIATIEKTALRKAQRTESRHFGHSVLSVGMSMHDFHSIKMRLLALGLIRRSERQHTPDNRNTYWRLTPRGEDYAIAMTPHSPMMLTSA